jgi:hypothetical protein
MDGPAIDTDFRQFLASFMYPMCWICENSSVLPVCYESIMDMLCVDGLIWILLPYQTHPKTTAKLFLNSVGLINLLTVLDCAAVSIKNQSSHLNSAEQASNDM